MVDGAHGYSQLAESPVGCQPYKKTASDILFLVKRPATRCGRFCWLYIITTTKFVTKALQRRKTGTRGTRSKGWGALYLRIALFTMRQSDRISCDVLYYYVSQCPLPRSAGAPRRSDPPLSARASRGADKFLRAAIFMSHLAGER
ncbi:hypothetical protein EVAR_48212_1 [Eumeta japonica]|uniref:Uncharacterized protein n=1 Tax=Eumeta variegata TaxID=151549 RepID=A0A4C1XW05_EUMVA|nr:hypothetical protein EVAR_48212_1 [Eumeta japonica]